MWGYTPVGLTGVLVCFIADSDGHELTQMSLNSRINSLAMIYEFELTQHKECELWVWLNSKFMWVWVTTTNSKINSLELPKLKTTDVDFLIEYRRVLLQPFAATLDAFQGQDDCFYGMILPKLMQLRHSVVQLQDTNLEYCVIHWLHLCWMECTAGHMNAAVERCVTQFTLQPWSR